MELKEACNIIQQVCNEHKGTKQEHVMIEQALIGIKEAMSKCPKCDVEPKEET